MPDLTLGLDLGSRAAKAVLFAPAESRIVSTIALDATPDKAADAVTLVRSVLDAAGRALSDVGRVTATGYGRVQAACADEATTEITCHAVGIAVLHPEARTIVEIGGQDSKVIRLSDDHRVEDFAMNDRCAAGTGRFLEVVARILGTDVRGLAPLVRRARAETEISSMCVVFAESEVIGMLAGGAAPEDIAAGIHRAIARRVAGLVERLGPRPPIAFTGGVALNPAMSAALGEELRERLIVPPDPLVTGAFGAAVSGRPVHGLPRQAGDRPGRRPERGRRRRRAPGPLGGVTSVLLHRIPALERFDRMVVERDRIRPRRESEGPQDRLDLLRVHAARAHPGRGGGPGLRLRRQPRDGRLGRAGASGEPLPAHQVELRVRPGEGQPALRDERPRRGRDDLRRQEEDVRAPGRSSSRSTSWSCPRSRRGAEGFALWLAELRRLVEPARGAHRDPRDRGAPAGGDRA